jgi:ATP-dependent Lon protease
MAVAAENEFAELEQRVEKAGLPAEARKKVDSELKKLRMMPPMSAEATVVRSYVDWMLSVPWKKRSRIGIDLKLARQILDADHYGFRRSQRADFRVFGSTVTCQKATRPCVVFGWAHQVWVKPH